MSYHADETALVLSGGAAYGAFAVGIMKALFAGRSPATAYQHLDANIVVGTSVGAFNAAVMASQSEINCLAAAENLARIWTDEIAARPGKCGNGIFRIRGDLRDYFDPVCIRAGNAPSRLAEDGWEFGQYLVTRTANFFASSAPLDDRAVGLLNIESFIDTKPMRDLLRATIKEADVRNSRKSLHITTTDWVTGKPTYFQNEHFREEHGFCAVMASTAVPGVFPPVRIWDRLYVDGGVVQNTPLQPAIDLGASELHVIYLDPDPSYIPLKGQPNTMDTLLRMYYMMLATKIAEDVETARWINRGLEVIEQYRETQETQSTTVVDLVRVVGKMMESKGRRYKRLVIHRYFPRHSLGTELGMLDFSLDQILKMMEEGERVAITHDCSENQCVN